MTIIFWTLIVLTLIPFVIYPCFITILGMLGAKKKANYLQIENPSVSLIISAYNEEGVIEEKISNSLLLEYPDIEITVLSDGSFDGTNDIVRKYGKNGVKLFEIKKNVGKTEAQNRIVSKCTAEIIVFSDANSLYKKDAILNLIKPFSDPDVGCVSGELRYQTQNKQTAADNEGVYWKYEQYIKRQESKIGTLLGANGAIYAVRRELYQPLPPDIISDFVEPLMILKKGKQVIYEPYAIAYENASDTLLDEFRRKKRIITRGLYGITYARSLMNIFRYPLIAIMLFCHRLLRWLLPLFMCANLFLNFALINKGIIYDVCLICHLLIYVLATAGFMMKRIKCKVFTVPLYFCMINYAAFVGIKNFLFRKKIISWNVVR